jgi:hypothetical protein
MHHLRNDTVLGEWRYSSTHSKTSELDAAEWLTSNPAILHPLLIGQEDASAPEPVWTRWWREKNSFNASSGNRAPNVQPVA